MELLEKWGYPVIPLAAVVKNRNTRTLPGNATVITIDDGWYSSYLHMVPILREYEYPATIYLTTYYCLNQLPVIDVALQYCFHQTSQKQNAVVHLPDYDFGPLPINSAITRKIALTEALERVRTLDGEREKQVFLRSICEETGVDYDELSEGRWFHLMTPSEVNSAAASVAIELHTHRHRITHNDQDSLKEELALNAEKIQEVTGSTPVHFCYPSGRFTRSIWPTLSDEKIASATTTTIGLTDERSEIYALPRILDGQEVSELEFEAEMCGFMQLIRDTRAFFFNSHG